MTTTLDVATPRGPARLYADLPEGDPSALLVLGHGAGGGVDAYDLAALTTLAAEGVAVLRFEQPWRTAGKKVAPAPAALDEGWAVAMALVAERWPGVPTFVGGRSAGARVAMRWSADHEVAGVVALAFPLHAPGKPERTRADELAGARPKVLVLQGERDTMGRPEEFLPHVEDRDDVRLVVVPEVGHDLRPGARAGLTCDDVVAMVVGEARTFLGVE
ncbi:hypothetical protein GCM10027418_14260 [Mariniluteicoccus endophyticus]